MATGGADKFDCRASQFYDLLPKIDQTVEADGADEFFDVVSTPPKLDEQKDEFFTPQVEPAQSRSPVGFLLPSIAEEPELNESERDVDMANESCNQPELRNKIKAKKRLLDASKVKKEIDCLAAQVFDGIRIEPPTPEKKHPMVTRLDVAVKTPTLTLRNRNVIRKQMKRHLQSPSSQGPPAKFMAMAEQVHHFFNDTPPRFRSSLKNHDLLKASFPTKDRITTVTIPQSPNLRTKTRARSPCHSEENYVMDSHEIKAHPLNPKVFQPPDLSSKPPAKPATVPVPFNLTKVQKKATNATNEETKFVQFKANAVPRSCRSSISSSSSSTQLQFAGATSFGLRRVRSTIGNEKGLEDEEDDAYLGINATEKTNKHLKVQPFSFEMRDRIARQAKEQKIKKIIEERSQIANFTARPVPSFILQRKDETRNSSVLSCHKHPELAVQNSKFKAKPATVLSKEPFKPKHGNIPTTEVVEFKLNTERRAEERAVLEEIRRAEKQRMEEENMKISRELEEFEKKQMKELRKSMMPKPTPPPSYLKK